MEVFMNLSDKELKVLKRTSRMSRMRKINFTCYLFIIVVGILFILIGLLVKANEAQALGIFFGLIGLSEFLSHRRQLELYNIVRKISKEANISIDH